MYSLKYIFLSNSNYKNEFIITCNISMKNNLKIYKNTPINKVYKKIEVFFK